MVPVKSSIIATCLQEASDEKAVHKVISMEFESKTVWKTWPIDHDDWSTLIFFHCHEDGCYLEEMELLVLQKYLQ